MRSWCGSCGILGGPAEGGVDSRSGGQVASHGLLGLKILLSIKPVTLLTEEFLRNDNIKLNDAFCFFELRTCARWFDSTIELMMFLLKSMPTD